MCGRRRRLRPRLPPPPRGSRAPRRPRSASTRPGGASRRSTSTAIRSRLLRGDRRLPDGPAGLPGRGARRSRGRRSPSGRGLGPQGRTGSSRTAPSLEADVYVFACGPWLGKLFPDVLGSASATRQEVFFFGTPAGDRASARTLPVWIDFGERIFYGIPGNDHRGFKVADDTRGEPFDPTSGERTPTPEALARRAAPLAGRFPALAGAPLLESRVCQYENSPDGHLLIDRHPGRRNVWLVGGGSGHGFKLGPAVGEHAAALVLGEAEPLPLFRLDRPVAVLKTQFGETS